MKRFQIYLTEKQDEAITKIADDNMGSKAAHIRCAIDEYLVKNERKVNYAPVLPSTFSLAFKDKEDKISYCPINQFQCTGMPYPLNDAIKLHKEHPGSLGTVGYFRDNEGFLRDSSQIVNFIK